MPLLLLLFLLLLLLLLLSNSTLGESVKDQQESMFLFLQTQQKGLKQTRRDRHRNTREDEAQQDKVLELFHFFFPLQKNNPLQLAQLNVLAGCKTISRKSNFYEGWSRADLLVALPWGSSYVTP